MRKCAKMCKESRHNRPSFEEADLFLILRLPSEELKTHVCKLQGTKPYEATEALSELLQRIPPFGDLSVWLCAIHLNQDLKWQQLHHTPPILG